MVELLLFMEYNSYIMFHKDWVIYIPFKLNYGMAAILLKLAVEQHNPEAMLLSEPYMIRGKGLLRIKNKLPYYLKGQHFLAMRMQRKN